MRHAFTLSTLSVLALTAPAAARQDGRAALLTRIDSVVQAEMAKSKTPGMSVAVQRGTDLLLARGYGLADVEHSVPATTETVYRIGSITKQFTAASIMQLIEAGKLSLDDEVTKILPDYPVQGHRVTIQHLLTHTSGIKSYTSLGPKFWNESARLELPDSQLVALFKNEPFDFDPGARWQYNNSGYYLLGVIIEKVSGLPYRRYLNERVLEPLGLRSTMYCEERPIIPNRAQGYEVRDGVLMNDDVIAMNTPGAAGAMCSTVLDLLAWRRALFSQKVVSAASLEKMTTPARLNDGSATTYGFGLGIGRLEGHRSISHGGGINGFITQLAYYPDDDVTVAVLGNLGSAPSSRVAEKIARLVIGIPLPRFDNVAIPPAERSRLAGSYETPVGIVTIQAAGDSLLVTIPGQSPQRLMSQGDGRYIPTNESDWTLRFTPPSGPVQEMEISVGDQKVKGKRKP